MDDGNGLLYMRARYYDPEVGRFINKDPIGFAGGDFNLYAYVGNNPINNIDPEGKEVMPPPNVTPNIPGYWSYLVKMAPWIFCQSLKQRIEHAEEENATCKEIGEPDMWKIDPDAYKALQWCRDHGYIK